MGLNRVGLVKNKST
jgi:hypothetical protein